MSRALFAAITLAITIALPARQAHAQRRLVPFIGGGLAKGTGDLSSVTDNGWSAFGGVDIPLGLNPGLSIGVTASYAHVPYTGAFSEAMNLTTLLGEVGYVIMASSSSIVKPYVRAGGGMQLRKYDPGSTAFREDSEGKLVFSAGGGLQFLVSSAQLFVGASFVTDADAGYLGFHGGLALPLRASPPSRAVRNGN